MCHLWNFSAIFFTNNGSRGVILCYTCTLNTKYLQVFDSERKQSTTSSAYPIGYIVLEVIPGISKDVPNS